ncbi:MAG TPA: hypothetical protein VM533_21085 [Fimbriiglobus sp.]|nr:hypothetical protein [Fimbriiglobus sp.]
MAGFRLELWCGKNDDGTYHGVVWVDGRPEADPDYLVLSGDCDALREIWRRARSRYQKRPQVVGRCEECFPETFLRGEPPDPD